MSANRYTNMYFGLSTLQPSGLKKRLAYKPKVQTPDITESVRNEIRNNYYVNQIKMAEEAKNKHMELVRLIGALEHRQVPALREEAIRKKADKLARQIKLLESNITIHKPQ